MATINLNVGTNDIVNINVQRTSQTNPIIDSNELYYKLEQDLKKFNKDRYEKDHKHWWYEVWYDFDEDFEEFIYPKIKDMDYEEQFTFCLGYMARRDSYYHSPKHYEDLDNMLKDLK